MCLRDAIPDVSSRPTVIQFIVANCFNFSWELSGLDPVETGVFEEGINSLTK